MTQAITNTKLNNLEDMLSNVEKTSKTTFDGTDKSLNDFKKIFDKTLGKTDEKESFKPCENATNEIVLEEIAAFAFIGIGARGIDSADINHKLFGIKTLKQMQVEHAGFERMNFYHDGRLAIITFPHALKEQYGAENENLETLIDVARCIKGVEVAAVIKQPEAENKFRVSMRSSCDVDVSEICAMYGGGGHVRAAGCTISADSILSAEMTIVLAVEDKLICE